MTSFPYRIYLPWIHCTFSFCSAMPPCSSERIFLQLRRHVPLNGYHIWKASSLDDALEFGEREKPHEVSDDFLQQVWLSFFEVLKDVLTYAAPLPLAIVQQLRHYHRADLPHSQILGNNISDAELPWPSGYELRLSLERSRVLILVKVIGDRQEGHPVQKCSLHQQSPN